MRHHPCFGPSPRIAARALALLGALVLLLPGAGCQTDPSAGGFNPSCLTFNADKDPLDGEVVSFWGLDSVCDLLQVEFVVTGVDDVWSASFEVLYPDELAQFTAVSFGDSFLKADGVDLFVEVQEDPPGLLEVGITRTDSAVNKGISPGVGNDLLIRLFFFRFATAGQGNFVIQNEKLQKIVNVGELPSDYVPPIPFSGGQFVIQN